MARRLPYREPSYAYPEPAWYRTPAVRPEAARYDQERGEFVLPYSAARTERPRWDAS